jgi:hypothetical protein
VITTKKSKIELEMNKVNDDLMILVMDQQVFIGNLVEEGEIECV